MKKKMQELIKSRRFILSVISLLMMVLVALVPELEPLEEAIVNTLTDVATVLVP